jgi:signal transduction histidine kinase/CheY-like chemotaxis protein
VAPAGHGTGGQVIARGAPYQSADVLDDPSITLTPEVRQRILAAGTRAYLSVPLRAHGVLMGALTVGAEAGRVFAHEEVELLQAFADQAALAIDNARLFERAQRAHAELSRAHEQLVRGETLRAVGELAAGASHHLNNLLAVVLGRVQMVLRRHGSTDVGRDLRPAERAVLDGADVVKRLARFSRGRPEPTIEPVDLNELVEDVVELTRPRWQNELEARGVRVETALELGSIPRAAADPPSVREVLVNLILNAVDALPRGGRVTVRTWATEDGVHCAVADDGVGMPAEVRRRVFEPFFTTKGVKSTGLGLSVAYGIIQRHGGELTVDTEEGGGTTVTFRLPKAARRPSAPPPAPGVPPSSRLRVLVIDDDAAVREVVADMLGEDGHAVLQAASGPEGLERLRGAERVDLVLTDLGMLGMNGWEVARAVQAAYPATVVGLLTGWDEELAPKPVEGSRVDLIVRKPVTQDTLRGVVAQTRALAAVKA